MSTLNFNFALHFVSTCMLLLIQCCCKIPKKTVGKQIADEPVFFAQHYNDTICFLALQRNNK